MKKEIKTDADALNKKYQQRIRLLASDESFIRAVNDARRKHKPLAKVSAHSFKEVVAFYKKNIGSVDTKNKISLDEFRKQFFLVEKKYVELINSKELLDTSIAVAKKFRLYPAEEWMYVIRSLIIEIFPERSLYEQLVLHNPWFKSISDYGFGVLQNCDVKLKKNPRTKENEILIRIYPDTSLGDLKKSWAYIKKVQLVLKNEIGSKQWYPLRNLDLAEDVLALDREVGIRKGTSDLDKQEKIFGETDSFSVEDKRISRIKQTRHRYKNRFGPKS